MKSSKQSFKIAPCTVLTVVGFLFLSVGPAHAQRAIDGKPNVDASKGAGAVDVNRGFNIGGIKAADTAGKTGDAVKASGVNANSTDAAPARSSFSNSTSSRPAKVDSKAVVVPIPPKTPPSAEGKHSAAVAKPAPVKAETPGEATLAMIKDATIKTELAKLGLKESDVDTVLVRLALKSEGADAATLKNFVEFANTLKGTNPELFKKLSDGISSGAKDIQDDQLASLVLAYVKRNPKWKESVDGDMPEAIHILTKAWDSNENGKMEAAEIELAMKALEVNEGGLKESMDMIKKLADKNTEKEAISDAKNKLNAFEQQALATAKDADKTMIKETIQSLRSGLTGNNVSTITAMHAIGKMEYMKNNGGENITADEIVRFRSLCPGKA